MPTEYVIQPRYDVSVRLSQSYGLVHDPRTESASVFGFAQWPICGIESLVASLALVPLGHVPNDPPLYARGAEPEIVYRSCHGTMVRDPSRPTGHTVSRSAALNGGVWPLSSLGSLFSSTERPLDALVGPPINLRLLIVEVGALVNVL